MLDDDRRRQTPTGQVPAYLLSSFVSLQHLMYLYNTFYQTGQLALQIRRHSFDGHDGSTLVYSN